jgi:16S rRNA (cytidine1402-2'-O)-methyltransferase
MPMSSNSTRLWVVATPLGNPGDLSPRAREALAAVDFILAEDTRRAGLLLAACSIVGGRLRSFHDHNEDRKLAGVLEELAAGKTAALISDAGTPLLSDPGFTLVRACRERGIGVSPVPGPTAPAAALSVSGLPPLPYAFLGFPPRKAKDVTAFFAPYACLPLTLIFFERRDRLAATLAAAHEALGARRACIARELTKTHEEFIFLALGGEVPALLGEITVVVGPPVPLRTPGETVLRRIRALRDEEGLKARAAAKRLHAECAGWSAKELYALLRRNETDDAP